MNRKQMIEVAIRVMTEDYYTETPAARRGRALGYTGLEHVRGCGSDDPDAHLCLPEHWAQCACFIQGCAVVDALVAAGCVPSDALTPPKVTHMPEYPFGCSMCWDDDQEPVVGDRDRFRKHVCNDVSGHDGPCICRCGQRSCDAASARGVSATPEAAVTPDERNEP